MKNICYLVLLLLFSCNREAPNCRIYATDILKGNPKKVYVAYRKKDTILGISDYGRDKTKAGAYYFFPNGELESYKFFETDSAYDYEEKYDSMGQLVKTIGRPLVDVRVREVNIDSAIVGYYLFSLHKRYRNVKVLISTGQVFFPALKDDTSYSNMKSFSINLSTRNLTRFGIAFSCDYENTCTLQKYSIQDTLRLIKNPRLNADE
jgi:hypothetical protein